MWLRPQGAISSLMGEMEANRCGLVWPPPEADLEIVRSTGAFVGR